ncbi:sigma-54-dependent Fis family transcriptional regulator [Roseovarius faecimaris]|uniref:Sigma-54-dependent Fis family transcriptional regulator n=1 Tax=Roseovarius faecimaris TaxID=2494550 RepID=A0A6I6IKK4_9RHOB|nr:sigma-54 dependent transcriptional regulator [Roseovarius faecimaris]QGX96812.1 sigma-54-dependent Fis family transcriptional regulator [Roseovarius faecimaris]
MIARVLLVDDDASVREALGQTLMLAEYEVTTAGSVIEAKDHIAPGFEGVVISDIRMPGQDGFALLAHVRKVDADLPVILLTGEGDIPMAVRGMSDGAYSFLEKPCPPKELLAVVERAMQTRALVMENRALKSQLETGDAASRLLFGSSALANGLRDSVRAAARAGTDVLITGAPGTGIAKVAHVVHVLSRRDATFEKRAGAALNPTALAEALALTADGSLFIDEVGNLPADSQLALNEAQDAGHAPRIIAGTSRDLAQEAHAGRFNPDLFYRLNVMSVTIPALKDRPEDIPVLFRHYVQAAAEQAQIAPPEIPPEVISRLMLRDWPGNSRDLMNAATRYVLGLSDFDSGEVPGLTEQMAQVEAAFLMQALRQNHGNATEAARALKLPRKTFYDKLARHGIRAEAFRE